MAPTWCVALLTEGVLCYPLPGRFPRSLDRDVSIPEGSPLMWSEQPSPRQPPSHLIDAAHALLDTTIVCEQYTIKNKNEM